MVRKVKEGLKCIKFTSRAGAYCTGDVASFRPDLADRYIDSGRALPYDLENEKFASSGADMSVATAADVRDWPDDEPEPAKPRTADPKSREKPSKRRVRSLDADKGEVETKG